MLEMSLQLFQNIVVLCTMAYLYAVVRHRLMRLPSVQQSLLEGVIFGAIASLGMLLPPTQIALGVTLDGRAVIIGVAGAFLRGWAVWLAALIAIICRVFLGGVGTIPGSAVIVMSALAGFALHLLSLSRKFKYSTLTFVVFGLLLAAIQLLWYAVLPADARPGFAEFSLPIIVLFPFGTLLIGKLLQRENDQFELHESLQLSDIVVKQCAEGMLVIDEDGIVCMSNVTAACMFVDAEECTDVSEQTLIGKPIAALVTPDSMATFAAATPPERITSQYIDLQGLRADGSTFPMRVTLSRMQAADLQGVIIVARDLTREQQAAQHARELSTEQAKVGALHGLIGEASHDLKTPISALRARLYLIDSAVTQQETLIERLTQGTLPAATLQASTEALKKQTQYIHNATEQLATLVTDMLDLVRIEGRGAPTLRQDNIVPFVRRCTDALTAQVSTARLTLSVEAPAPVTAIFNAIDFARALDNLLMNAIVYTPTGGAITVRVTGAPGEALIAVEDTGIGIEQADLTRVFERFYRTNTARTHQNGGSGLGLAISRRLIEEMGGTVEVTSTPDVGSTFTIRLIGSRTP